MTWSNLPAEMPPAPAQHQTARAGSNFASWAQLIGSVLAALTLVGLALIFLVQALILWRADETAPVTTSILFAVGVGFGGMLTLPSAWFALLRLMGRSPSTTLPAWFPRQFALWVFLLVLMPISLVWGDSLAVGSGVTWLVLPVLQLVVVTTPIIWLVHLAGYKLPFSSPQRKWGVFASGLVIGPGIIISLEIAIGAVFLLGLILLLATQPGLLEQFASLVEQVQSGTLSPDQAGAEILPYMQQPVVAYLAIAFIAVLVPLLEELLKPIGVWMLAGRKLTSAEGFLTGVLSGAGFALMENLGYGAANLGSWSGIVLARSGTAAMHITTAGMMGWALSATWRDGRYGRLVATYLAAVVIHGLWNGITVSFGLLGTQLMGTAESAILFQVIAAAILGLFLLALLLGMNAALRRAIMRSSVSAPLESELPQVETILLNEEDPDNGISASTG